MSRFPQPLIAPPPAFVTFVQTGPRLPEMPDTLQTAARYLAAYRGRPLNYKNLNDFLDVERMHKAIRFANGF